MLSVISCLSFILRCVAPQALKLINETFSLGLQNIFAHYISKAHLRRNNAVSVEKMKQKELLRQSGHVETDKEAVALVISPARLQNLQYLKNLMKSQREMISYKEYLQVRLVLLCVVVLSSVRVTFCYAAVKQMCQREVVTFEHCIELSTAWWHVFVLTLFCRSFFVYTTSVLPGLQYQVHGPVDRHPAGRHLPLSGSAAKFRILTNRVEAPP